MSCTQWQKEILLAESGELSAHKRLRLEEHLRRCAACGAYQAQLRGLTAAASEVLTMNEPRAWVMTRIRAMAAEGVSSHNLRLHPLTVRLLATAALLAVFAGALFLVPSRRRHVGRIDEMTAILAMVASDSTLQVEAFGDNAAAAMSEVAEASDRESSLKALARKLLIMEGMSVDGEDELFLTSPLDEPQPTALQLYRTAGVRGQIYG